MGDRRASSRSTSGWSTSAASPICIATATGRASARSKPMASTTRSPSRTRNMRAAGRASSRRSTQRLEGARRRVRLEARLGAAELVRRRRRRAARPSIPSAAATGSTPVGRRAPGDAGARRPLRPVVLRQVRAPRPRCGARRCLDRRQRRRPAAGPADLHADAQLARRHRVRPDRRAARRGPLLHRHRHRLPHPRLRLDPPEHSPPASTRR